MNSYASNPTMYEDDKTCVYNNIYSCFRKLVHCESYSRPAAGHLGERWDLSGSGGASKLLLEGK